MPTRPPSVHSTASSTDSEDCDENYVAMVSNMPADEPVCNTTLPRRQNQCRMIHSRHCDHKLSTLQNYTAKVCFVFVPLRLLASSWDLAGLSGLLRSSCCRVLPSVRSTARQADSSPPRTLSLCTSTSFILSPCFAFCLPGVCSHRKMLSFARFASLAAVEGSCFCFSFFKHWQTRHLNPLPITSAENRSRPLVVFSCHKQFGCHLNHSFSFP